MRNPHDRRHLPSLRALRAFETTVRHGSFTAAADALHLTQGAVSRQIVELERLVKRPLFLRSGPKLVLTETGRRLGERVMELLDLLGDALADAEGSHGKTVVTLSMLPSVAALWLAPRLDQLVEDLPQIDLDIMASRHLVNFRVDGVDAAVRYGHGQWSNTAVEFIGGETLRPVCTPAYAERHELRRPADLISVRLFHTDLDVGWKEWLAGAGVDWRGVSGATFLGDGAAVMHAVLSDQGVALGRTLLIADDLATGRLVAPFDPPLASSHSYWFVTRSDQIYRDDVKALRHWIVARMRQTLETAVLTQPASN
ncbi:MAG: LysR substrate-binding domain-containing protein [Geminicoccaceae bacterium]